MMRRWFSQLLVFASLALSAFAEPVTARWGGPTGTDMAVEGIDDAGMIRLVPLDGAAGEARLPIAEADELHFVLPETYAEAQRRDAAGRPAEAIFLLQNDLPALVPYALVPQSNAQAAVRFYYRLLIGQQRWPEAMAVATALTAYDGHLPLAEETITLIRRLLAADRIEDATTLLARLPLDMAVPGLDLPSEVTAIAHSLRRAGHWAEAETIYQRLRDASATPTDWDALLAYCHWHQGHPLLAAAWIESQPDSRAFRLDHDGLHGLLAGLVLLARDETVPALDVLAETLVGTSAASEWRVELSANIAIGYRIRGEDTLARSIETDLLTFHPHHPAVLALSESP